jgi:hypothetical protein
MLAIAILLLWLAGLSFFVAFEGTKLIGSAGVAGGGSASYIGKLEQGLAGQVQQAAQNTGGTP